MNLTTNVHQVVSFILTVILQEHVSLHNVIQAIWEDLGDETYAVGILTSRKYRKFAAEAWMPREDSLPTYQTFVNVWKHSCSKIKLKASMRFTKCDCCVMAREALDRHRLSGTCTSEEFATIKKGLDDHLEVSGTGIFSPYLDGVHLGLFVCRFRRVLIFGRIFRFNTSCSIH